MSITEVLKDWSDAKTWCSNYGTGWYLPSLDELKVIYNNKSAINSTLSANGSTSLVTGYYWSSAEYYTSASTLSFSNGNSRSVSKSDTYNVRAVLAFYLKYF